MTTDNISTEIIERGRKLHTFTVNEAELNATLYEMARTNWAADDLIHLCAIHRNDDSNLERDEISKCGLEVLLELSSEAIYKQMMLVDRLGDLIGISSHRVKTSLGIIQSPEGKKSIAQVKEVDHV